MLKHMQPILPTHHTNVNASESGCFVLPCGNDVCRWPVWLMMVNDVLMTVNDGTHTLPSP